MDSAIASLIGRAEGLDSPASEALFAALYSQLHRLAERELARRGHGATLGVTTLLHEAYLDIARREGAEFCDEARFMCYAARVMRGSDALPVSPSANALSIVRVPPKRTPPNILKSARRSRRRRTSFR